jgi:hypothetical protein
MSKNSKTSVIESKLNQPATASKKALYSAIAASAILVVFAVSALLIVLHAEASKEIVELANLCVLSLGALATTLVTGQAAIDFKGMSVLQHLSEDEKIDSNAEAPDMVVNQRIQKSRWHDDGVL